MSLYILQDVLSQPVVLLRACARKPHRVSHVYSAPPPSLDSTINGIVIFIKVRLLEKKPWRDFSTEVQGWMYQQADVLSRAYLTVGTSILA